MEVKTINPLRDALAQVYLGGNREKNNYMHLYHMVYLACTKKTPAGFNDSEWKDNVKIELYRTLREVISNHCDAILEAKEACDLGLQYYLDQWGIFSADSKVLNGACAYLNRFYVRRERENGNKEIYEIYQLACFIWKDKVFKAMQPVVAILSLIENYRIGRKINYVLLRNAIQSFVEIDSTGVQDKQGLGTYQLFEKKFLEATKEFYSRESLELLNSKPVTDYMKMVVQRLSEERKFVNMYLHPSTFNSLMEVCKNVLIQKHLVPLNQEFKNLLQLDKKDDMGRLYKLVSRLENSFGEMKDNFEAHIFMQGAASIEELNKSANLNPIVYVNAIMEVYNRYRDLVFSEFSSNSRFLRALDKACEKFINHNIVSRPFRTSEILARYCDLVLFKAKKNPEVSKIVDSINKVMIVFQYLEDKDVFQRLYIQVLVHRFITNISCAEDDLSMINSLKHINFRFAPQLQRMHQDIIKSKELNDCFKTWVKSKSKMSTAFDLKIQVVSAASWPLTKSNDFAEFAIPYELEQSLNLFNQFYNEKRTRKLTWLYNHFKGDVITNCFKKRYTFRVSVFQMAFILLFNTKDTYQVSELIEATKLKKEILLQVLQSLLKVKLLMLPESERECDLNENTTVTLHKDYNCTKSFVKIDAPLKAQVKEEQNQAYIFIEKDGKFLIQAAIVRIMKVRKQLKLQVLVAEVVKELAARFDPPVATIKKCVDILVEKDYLEQSSADNETYIYLP